MGEGHSYDKLDLFLVLKQCINEIINFEVNIWLGWYAWDLLRLHLRLKIYSNFTGENNIDLKLSDFLISEKKKTIIILIVACMSCNRSGASFNPHLFA